jgi:hypothetical protein
MRRAVVSAVLVTASVLIVSACGGGGGADSAPNTAAYLTFVHSPMVGTLSSQPDATLLAIGNRACGDLDRGMRSDAVVADIGGNPLPGSADFNGYSFVTVAAARELCPAHKADFAGSADLSGSG